MKFHSTTAPMDQWLKIVSLQWKLSAKVTRSIGLKVKCMRSHLSHFWTFFSNANVGSKASSWWSTRKSFHSNTKYSSQSVFTRGARCHCRHQTLYLPCCFRFRVPTSWTLCAPSLVASASTCTCSVWWNRFHFTASGFGSQWCASLAPYARYLSICWSRTRPCFGVWWPTSTNFMSCRKRLPKKLDHWLQFKDLSLKKAFFLCFQPDPTIASTQITTLHNWKSFRSYFLTHGERKSGERLNEEAIIKIKNQLRVNCLLKEEKIVINEAVKWNQVDVHTRIKNKCKKETKFPSTEM